MSRWFLFRTVSVFRSHSWRPFSYSCNIQHQTTGMASPGPMAPPATFAAGQCLAACLTLGPAKEVSTDTIAAALGAIHHLRLFYVFLQVRPASWADKTRRRSPEHDANYKTTRHSQREYVRKTCLERLIENKRPHRLADGPNH